MKYKYLVRMKDNKLYKTKSFYGLQMRGVTISMIFALTLLLSLNFVSAGTEFWQTKEDLGNGTIKNHLVLIYDKENFNILDTSTLGTSLYDIILSHFFGFRNVISSSGLVADYVSGNNPYEVYLLYNIYPKQFNIANPLQKVDNCNWVIYYWAKSSSNAVVVLNETYTEQTGDVSNAKYFMRLYDGDSLMADQICKFEDNTFDELSLPAEMQIVTASWECKACQYYEWSVQNKNIVKAKSIGENIVEISGYIKKFFKLNFEIWLSLFWIFLILMIFVALGFLFLSVYWIYKYLSGVIR